MATAYQVKHLQSIKHYRSARSEGIEADLVMKLGGLHSLPALSVNTMRN